MAIYRSPTSPCRCDSRVVPEKLSHWPCLQWSSAGEVQKQIRCLIHPEIPLSCLLPLKNLRTLGQVIAFHRVQSDDAFSHIRPLEMRFVSGDFRYAEVRTRMTRICTLPAVASMHLA